ncbi:MAG TPA: sigma-70 family RNA polymerase sigma factor [Terrimicrobiaceae bacterium]
MSSEEIIDFALERYERPLISYAKTITRDLESAKDAVQETFLRLSRQDAKALEARLAPWLYLVCRNCALDHLRKVARFSTDPIDEDFPAADASPATAAAAAEDKERLRLLIDQLPQLQRELVHLKFEAGLSYKEIAEATRISVSNVGLQLHTATQQLRRLWKRESTGVTP